ncbi:MAG: DUF1015 domain-containing protein [Lachnospiraceae bacterium]|nr:DUF1015 domain-containing protein [Lachnospiraceae bacterium]MBR4542510.1 DUF1015 domain-containing protein [Lachnospiraceae bacterium]
MAVVKPFKCVRPAVDKAALVAALPYDVYNRAEATEAVQGNDYSFLRIDRAETSLPEYVDTYDPQVYKHAKKLFQERMADGTFISDPDDCYYVYELIMNGRHQTGITACCSIDDYVNNVIKKHENTVEAKEYDRINHVDTLSAHTGPIFLAYRSNEIISAVVNKVKEGETLYSFTSDDGITHNVWKIDNADDIKTIQTEFEKINSIYIADGHHRCASAVKAGLKRRDLNPEYTGEEEFNFFLSVLFPEDQLMIMPYNRVVSDLNDLTEEELLESITGFFIVRPKDGPFAPDRKYTFAMLLGGKWYELEAKDFIKRVTDPVKKLDVSILQTYLLDPVLGIKDPRKDKRIAFIGGIRGIKELERRCKRDMKVAFAMYPTSIQELFAVADEGRLMPPKSTWFEPKLRSGLFIHKF